MGKGVEIGKAGANLANGPGQVLMETVGLQVSFQRTVT